MTHNSETCECGNQLSDMVEFVAQQCHACYVKENTAFYGGVVLNG